MTNTKEQKGTKKLKKTKYGVSARLKLVLDTYEITIPKAVKCTPVWDKNINMIVVNLRKELADKEASVGKNVASEKKPVTESKAPAEKKEVPEQNL